MIVLACIGVYLFMGIVALGLKRFWMLTEGVTPEYEKWWHKFAFVREKDPWEHMTDYDYVCGVCPKPYPPKRPHSTRWYFKDVLLALFWFIILPLALIILIVRHVYSVYPKQIAESLHRRLGNGSRLD